MTHPLDPPPQAPDSALPDLSGAGDWAPQAPEAEAPPPSFDGYQLLQRIGEGGMGRVFRALQLGTGRQVALKLMRTAALDSEMGKARFAREVRVAASLEHPGIARVYDSGLYRGHCYYVMELVEGVGLDQYVATKQPAPGDVLRLMLAVCRAVGFAHGRQIVHRDLKPSNILVTPDGQPHLVDFGLAKVCQGDEADPLTLTITGELTGTPAYMAPELLQGPAADADPRTDVYSLGVILYRLATGQPPHEAKGSPYQIIRRVVEERIRPPRELNPDLDQSIEAVILKCLSRTPADRYPDAEALAADLDRHLSGRRPLAVSTPPRRSRWMRSSIVAGLVVLLVTAGIATYWRRPGPAAGGAGLDPPGGTAQAREHQPLPPAPEMLFPCHESRAAILEGKLYIVGGRTGHGGDTTCVPVVQVYDPEANRWHLAAPLPEGRAGVGLIAHEGRLYCFGGLYEPYWWGWPSNSAYRYTPATDRWEALPRMPIARSNFVVGELGGRLYCAGGNIHWPNATNRVDAFDPATSTWSTVAPMPEPRGDGLGGTWNGRLVVSSGAATAHQKRTDAMIYDPASGAWSRHPAAPTRFGAPGCLLWADANALYLAGRRGDTGDISDTTWLCRYEPLSGKVEFLAQLAALGVVADVAAFDPLRGLIYAGGGIRGKDPVLRLVRQRLREVHGAVSPATARNDGTERQRREPP